MDFSPFLRHSTFLIVLLFTGCTQTNPELILQQADVFNQMGDFYQADSLYTLGLTKLERQKNWEKYFQSAEKMILNRCLLSTLDSTSFTYTINLWEQEIDQGNKLLPVDHPWLIRSRLVDNVIRADSFFYPELRDSLSWARNTYLEVAEEWAKLEDWKLFYECRIKAAIILRKTGNSSHSIDSLQALLPGIRKFLGSKHQLEAMVYHNMAAAHFQKEEDAQNIEYSRKALSINYELSPPVYHEIMRENRNIAKSYKWQQQLDSVERHCNQIFNIIDTLNAKGINFDLKTVAGAYQLDGEVAVQQGDLDRAENSLKNAVNFRKNAARSAVDTNLLAIAYNDLANCKAELSRFGEAEELFRQAISLLRKSSQRDSKKLADVYNNYSTSLIRKGDSTSLQRAKKLLNSSLQINLSLEGRDDQLANNWINESIILNKEKKHGKALQAIEKAESLAPFFRLDAIWENRGDAFTGLGQFKRAVSAYDSCIAYSLPEGLGADSIPAQKIIGNKRDLIKTLYLKSHALFLLHRSSPQYSERYLIQAIHTQDILQGLIDSLRKDYIADRSKESLANFTKPFFEHGIELCLEALHHIGDASFREKALWFSEKSKSMILLDAFRKTKATQLAGIDSVILQREKTLRLSISSLEKQLFAHSLEKAPFEADQQLRIQNSLTEKQQDLKKLQDRLFRTNPKYKDLLHGNPASVTDIRQLLMDDQSALVEYFLGDRGLFVFVITQQAFDHHRDSTLNASILKSWVDTLTKGIYGSLHPSNISSIQTMAVSYQLYQHVFEPLPIPIGTQKVILIPDDVLSYVPFDALMLKPHYNKAFEELAFQDYLISSYQFSYNYSISLLSEMINNPVVQQDREMNLLTFAPLFSKSLEAPYTEGLLAPFKNSKKEIKKLRKIVFGEFFCNQWATRELFLKHAPHYPVIYISSHGVVLDTMPEYSYLVFTPSSRELHPTNDLLFVKDLYQLELSAELIVLDACETSSGALQKGEGVISLARGFSYAGARSMVTTLLEVSEEEGGASLIVNFFEELLSGYSKGEALWRAKKRYFKEHSELNSNKLAPNYWSSFILVGDDRRIALLPR